MTRGDSSSRPGGSPRAPTGNDGADARRRDVDTRRPKSLSRPWGEVLREWREDVKHWSRPDLKEHIEAASYRLKEVRGRGLDIRLIARWENGEVRRPQAAYVRMLAYLGAPLPAAGASQPIYSTGHDEADMDRRRFLQTAGTALAATVVPGDGEVPAARLDANVGADDVGILREAVSRLYTQDQSMGGGSLVREGVRQYLNARHMLDHAGYSDSVARELMVITGELAVCVGWLSYDAGNQHQARALYVEAFLLADQAGDTNLSVQAVEKMALQSVYIADREQRRGTAREATRLAARLPGLVRYETSPRLHALVAGRQAIAHAVAGDKEEFRQAIRRARRELDRSNDHGREETWLQFVTPSEIVVHEAKGLRYLAQPALAADLYRTSLRSPDLSLRNRINYRAQLAGTLVALGDLRGALEEGRSVLADLHGQVVSPRTVAELSTLRRTAPACRDDEFCALYDKLAKECA